jgi:CheY-like chemotaxis protein
MECYRITEHLNTGMHQSALPIEQGTALIPSMPVPATQRIMTMSSGLRIGPLAADDKPMRIIVIDDDQAILNLYVEVLQDEGYQVIACDSQADAVECIRREQPELVILDLWMQSPISGWEIYQQLATHPEAAMIPVIISTAATERHLEPPADLQGAKINVLLKPFEIDDLLAAVKAGVAR